MNHRPPRRLLLVLTLLAAAACHPGMREAQRVTLDGRFTALGALRRSDPPRYRAAMSEAMLVAQGGLGLLGFGPGRYTGRLDAATRNATRRYEAARGLPPTGNPLSASTYPRLEADAQRLLRIGTPWVTERNFDTTDWRESAEADGPWVARGVEKPAAVTVQCDRREMQCTVAESEYGAEGSTPSLDWYDVASWDAVEIRSKPLDDECQRSVLVLNRVQESVTLTRTLLSDDSSCVALQNDTSSAYNRSAHLATDAEVAAIHARHLAVVFDTLLHLSPTLRRTLAPLADSAAGRPRHPPDSAAVRGAAG